MNSIPTIAIVGRPNVGKSSLFNRIVGRRAAVVSDREGVTRDRHYQETTWNEVTFNLVDTGGFLTDTDVDVMADSVREQIMVAVRDATLVLFVVDGRVGVTKEDLNFATIIKKENTEVVLVANKCEAADVREEHYHFLKLGLGDPATISAKTGYAVNSFLDKIIAMLPEASVEKQESREKVIKFAIIGRPNAGKSTLLNCLLNENRQIISDVPGTTRDSIDCAIEFDGRKYVITDTAGMRKKAKVSDEVEYFSNMRTLESIRRSDVCILMTEAGKELEVQDFRIINLIKQNAKGLIIAINKWDAVEKEDKTFDHLVKSLRQKDRSLETTPIISISAKEGQRVNRLIGLVNKVYENCFRVLGRDRLVELFEKAVFENVHPNREAKKIHLKRACQIMVNPPVVCIETNHPDLIDESWKRYFLNRLHKEFDLAGAPLRLNFDKELSLRKDEDLEQYH